MSESIPFREILKKANQRDPLPAGASAEETFAYYALLGVGFAYGKSMIVKSQCTAITTSINRIFEQLINSRYEVFEAEKKQQQHIIAAEEKLSKLMKSITPGADCERCSRCG